MSKLFGKKNNTKTASTSNTTAAGTSRAYAPDWITNAAQGLTEKVGALGAADPLTYVAGADPLQLQAGAAASRLGTFGSAPSAPAAPASATASGPPADIGSFLSRIAGATAGYDPVQFAKDHPVDPNADHSYANTDAFPVGPAGTPQGPPAAGMGQADAIAKASGGFAGTSPAEAPQAVPADPWVDARDLTRSVATASAPQTDYVDSSQMIGKFLDPYTQQVVDSTLKDFDFNAGQTRAQQDLDLAGSGAFGGSGAALTKSETEGQLGRARASTESGLRSQGFAQALAAAQAEAGRKQGANDTNAGLRAGQLDRRLGAGGQIADIAGAFGNDARANIGTQAGVGEVLRGITGDKARAPLDLASWQGQSLPDILAQFFGSDTTGTSHTDATGSSKNTQFDPMKTAGQVAQIAALFAGSDRRIKRNVHRLATRADGLGLYVFRYLTDPRWFVGVMAQEVLKIKPQAVAVHPLGFLMVDYAQIGAL